jgi:hypothetical protein
VEAQDAKASGLPLLVDRFRSSNPYACHSGARALAREPGIHNPTEGYGGRLSSDSGVMLLALVEGRRNVAAILAALIADRRDPSHVRHTVADVRRARMLAIACGYSPHLHAR